MSWTEREKNLVSGVKETLRMNSATPEERIKVCKKVLEDAKS